MHFVYKYTYVYKIVPLRTAPYLFSARGPPNVQRRRWALPTNLGSHDLRSRSFRSCNFMSHNFRSRNCSHVTVGHVTLGHRTLGHSTSGPIYHHDISWWCINDQWCIVATNHHDKSSGYVIHNRLLVGSEALCQTKAVQPNLTSRSLSCVLTFFFILTIGACKQITHTGCRNDLPTRQTHFYVASSKSSLCHGILVFASY